MLQVNIANHLCPGTTTRALVAVLSRMARKSALIPPCRSGIASRSRQSCHRLTCASGEGSVKVSIKFTDLQAFTSDDPDTVPTTQAEKERIVQVLNHHRSERADNGPDGFPASDVSRDESRMSGIPR